MSQSDNLSTAVVHKKSAFSSIWLLPVIAALIGSWLVVKSFMDAGIEVIVKLPSVEGITVGKTEVRYKGIIVGKVTEISFNKDADIENLNVHIEMLNTTKPFLNESTVFWLVEPKVGLSGISGLETVLTGKYFEILAEADETKAYVDVFEVTREQPPLEGDTPGLHIQLTAENKGSVGRGSEVYYKQVAVGYVYDTQLSADNSEINIKVLIDPQYAHLVKSNSRFWNASGIEISGSISAFKVRTQSIASIIGGGIAFITPEDKDAIAAKNTDKYALFEDYDAAKAGVLVRMNFPRNSKLEAEGTKVIFENIEVGYLKTVKYDVKTENLYGDVYFVPEMAKHLKDNLQFWLVSPSISAAGINNLGTLLQGPYITFRLSEEEGQYADEFDVSASAPPLDFTQEGLHLKLKAADVDSIYAGATVYFKHLSVGSVQSTALLNDNETFEVHVHILPEYEYLVNKSTIFYQLGGIEFSGNLQSFSFRTAPLAAMLSGGVTFHTLDHDNGEKINDGDAFTLFDNFHQARNTESIELILPANMKPLSDGHTQLKYKGSEIGLVIKQDLSKDNQTIVAQVNYRPEFKSLFKQSTKIWLVEPEITAQRIKLDTLISGAYLELHPGHGEFESKFTLFPHPAAKEAADAGLQIKFKVPQAGSIDIGSVITYRQRKIGEVDLVKLDDEGEHVNIYATIFDEYRPLVTVKSRFYNASGVEVQGGLAGVTIRTQSLASILTGGIALFNDESITAVPANEDTFYTLFPDEISAQYDGKKVNLTFEGVVDVKVGADVRLSNHLVGKVTQVQLTDTLAATQVELMVAEKFKTLFKTDSQYWLSSARVSVAEIREPMALLMGNFISVRAGSANASEQFDFQAKLIEPPLEKLLTGLNLVLTSDFAGSLKKNDPVYYRQIKVGKVLGVDLNKQANGIRVFINIENRFTHLVNQRSKFWNASGINIDAGLFSGVNIQTESLEAIAAGGIAFATPVVNNIQSISQGQGYTLHAELDDDWLDWQPVLIPLKSNE